MFDPKCYEFAEHFLPTDTSTRLKDELAQHIHDAIKDWATAERDRLAAVLLAIPTDGAAN